MRVCGCAYVPVRMRRFRACVRAKGWTGARACACARPGKCRWLRTRARLCVHIVGVWVCASWACVVFLFPMVYVRIQTHLPTHSCTRTHTHAHTHARTHTRARTHPPTHTHTHTHTHPHTHTRTHTQLGQINDQLSAHVDNSSSPSAANLHALQRHSEVLGESTQEYRRTRVWPRGCACVCMGRWVSVCVCARARVCVCVFFVCA